MPTVLSHLDLWGIRGLSVGEDYEVDHSLFLLFNIHLLSSFISCSGWEGMNDGKAINSTFIPGFTTISWSGDCFPRTSKIAVLSVGVSKGISRGVPFWLQEAHIFRCLDCPSCQKPLGRFFLYLFIYFICLFHSYFIFLCYWDLLIYYSIPTDYSSSGLISIFFAIYICK